MNGLNGRTKLRRARQPHMRSPVCLGISAGTLEAVTKTSGSTIIETLLTWEPNGLRETQESRRNLTMIARPPVLRLYKKRYIYPMGSGLAVSMEGRTTSRLLNLHRREKTALQLILHDNRH